MWGLPAASTAIVATVVPKFAKYVDHASDPSGLSLNTKFEPGLEPLGTAVADGPAVGGKSRGVVVPRTYPLPSPPSAMAERVPPGRAAKKGEGHRARAHARLNA